jgi:hypothetical protein
MGAETGIHRYPMVQSNCEDVAVKIRDMTRTAGLCIDAPVARMTVPNNDCLHGGRKNGFSKGEREHSAQNGCQKASVLLFPPVCTQGKCVPFLNARAYE